MKISAKGLAIIKEFESCKLEAYLCPAGVLTIGWGHTGADVHEGMCISQERADELLRGDVALSEQFVAKLVKVPLRQGQFDALVSFTYNIGPGALMHSTLLRQLNMHNYVGAANEFSRWNKSKGKVLAGLVRRRAAERALFLS